MVVNAIAFEGALEIHDQLVNPFTDDSWCAPRHSRHL